MHLDAPPGWQACTYDADCCPAAAHVLLLSAPGSPQALCLAGCLQAPAAKPAISAGRRMGGMFSMMTTSQEHGSQPDRAKAKATATSGACRLISPCSVHLALQERL